MNRLIPIILVSPLFLGGAALAQSFEPPSISGFSGMSGFEVPQIDPPSLDFDTGTSDAGDSDPDFVSDLAEVGEAIDTVLSGAWENQPASGSGSANPGVINPDILNPGSFSETDPGVALLELLAAFEEEVRKGMTKPDLIEGLIREPIEAARPKVREIVVVGSKVKEVVRSGLQQGRVLLDSDFGP